MIGAATVILGIGEAMLYFLVLGAVMLSLVAIFTAHGIG